MIPGFADQLKITNVTFDVESKRLLFYIEHDEKNAFTNQYELILDKIEGKYYSKEIKHGICAFECFCGEVGERTLWKECKFLTNYVDEIFERLKEHPKLRLHALFF